VRVGAQVANFCSPAPVENQMAPAAHAATTGVTCGRPSARTVETQNSSACFSALRVSSRPVAVAAGSLYRSSNVVTGVDIGISHGGGQRLA
jgi:hypothetical protein